MEIFFFYYLNKLLEAKNSSSIVGTSLLIIVSSAVPIAPMYRSRQGTLLIIHVYQLYAEFERIFPVYTMQNNKYTSSNTDSTNKKDQLKNCL